MEIIVTKDSLKIAEKDLVHKGEYNVNELTFTFSEEYEGLSKMAVFSNTLNAVQTAITNNTCIIPAEILLKKMDLTIGVYAYTLENNVLVKRLSPAPITIKVENGSYIKGLRNPQIDNPTLFEQFMEQLEGNIDDLQEQINSKQDTLTPGDNITIENGVISANVPTKTSDLINDSGFIDKTVNDLTNYTKTSELSSVAMSGDYNDLDNKPIIPTKVSELQNDENYQTYDDVEAMISALGSVFTLKGTVNTIADLPQTGNQVGDVWYVKSESAGYVWINDDGTLRWEMLGSTVDTSDFLTKSGLAQTTGQNTDNAMSQKAITDALNTKQATLNNSNKLNPDYVATNTNKQFTSETEKANWNNKSDFSGDYNDLTNKPDLTIYEEKTDAETKYETLLSQIPTNTATGTTINVQDSSNLPLKDFALGGNATQGADPTPDSPQDIHVVTGDNTVVVNGKNLYNATKTISESYWADNTEIHLNGSPTSSTRRFFNTMNLKAGTYTFNVGNLRGSATRLELYLYKGTSWTVIAQLQSIAGNMSTSFTLTQDTDITLALYTYSTSVYTNVVLNYQVVRGTTADYNFEPYTEQTQLLSLGNIELAKIGTYTDRIFKSGGKWYVEKNIQKLTFTGADTENWTLSDTGTPNWSYRISQAMLTYDYTIISNLYSFAGGSIYNGNTIQGISNQKAGTSSTSIRIRYGTEDTLTNYKTWLSTHNLIVYLALTTPTTTEITDTTLIGQLENILQMHTNKNVTNISIVPTGTNAEPTAEVEYRVDLGTVIGNINNAIISLGGNV